MKRSALRFGAAAAATSLVLLSVSPAQAADPVSQADASAIQIGIGGTPVEVVPRMTATNDGTKETTTGEANPPVSVLQNQGLANVGVLTQQATARTTPGDPGKLNGTSAACAGIAGEGGSVAAIGESNCITPGEPVGVTMANLDLTGVQLINPGSALGPLAELNPFVDQILSAITAPLSDALADALGDTGIYGTIGAVEARCVANPGSASGTANIVDTKLFLNVAGTEVILAELPVEPDPNTNLLLDIDFVLANILDAVEIQLTNALDGALDPASELVGTLRAQFLDNLLEQVATNLEPLLEALNENVLEVILNKQVSGDDGKSINVTALSLRLLPGAEQAGIDSLLNLQIGDVNCGPNTDFELPVSTPTPETPEPNVPDVPTKVTSGVATEPGSATAGAGLLAALLALGTAAGVAGFRRSRKA